MPKFVSKKTARADATVAKKSSAVKVIAKTSPAVPSSGRSDRMTASSINKTRVLFGVRSYDGAVRHELPLIFQAIVDVLVHGALVITRSRNGRVVRPADVRYVMKTLLGTTVVGLGNCKYPKQKKRGGSAVGADAQRVAKRAKDDAVSKRVVSAKADADARKKLSGDA